MGLLNVSFVASLKELELASLSQALVGDFGTLPCASTAPSTIYSMCAKIETQYELRFKIKFNELLIPCGLKV